MKEMVIVKFIYSIFASMFWSLIEVLSGGAIPVDKKTFNSRLKKGQYPYSEEEKAYLASIDRKAKKKAIRKLNKKYVGRAKK